MKSTVGACSTESEGDCVFTSGHEAAMDRRSQGMEATLGTLIILLGPMGSHLRA